MGPLAADRALREMDIDHRFVPVVRGSRRRLEVNRAIRPRVDPAPVLHGE